MTLYQATVVDLPKLRAEIAGVEATLISENTVIINADTIRRHLEDLRQILKQRTVAS